MTEPWDELCEGCGDPAVTFDREGIPRCAECASIPRREPIFSTVFLIVLAVVYAALWLASIFLAATAGR